VTLPDDLSELVRALSETDTAQLRKQWAILYGLPPAPRISRELLIRGIGYRLQEDACGGLSKVSGNQLVRLARDLSRGRGIPSCYSQIAKSGTKLIREWKGTVHEVIVTPDGYQWRGNLCRSLSEIARAITGTRWSGPRFFGVERKTSGPTFKARAGAEGGHTKDLRATHDD
jgi:hypothetical protein